MFIANIEEMEMRNREATEHREQRARRRAGSDAEDAPAGGAGEDSGSEDVEVCFRVCADCTSAVLAHELRYHRRHRRSSKRCLVSRVQPEAMTEKRNRVEVC
jgi:hypothetical protein